MTLCGTIKKGRKEVPHELRQQSGRTIESSTYRFTKIATLLSFVPKKNRVVTLLSSRHLFLNQEEREEIKKIGKPRMILDYNARKGGVDTIDQIKDNYTVQRPTRRWTLAQFMMYLDIIAINSHTIYCIKKRDTNPDFSISRAEFIWKLWESLVGPHLANRKQKGYRGVQLELQRSIDKVYFSIFQAEEPMSQSSSSPLPYSKPAKCPSCPPNSKSETRLRCQQCNKPSCKNHIRKICKSCLP